MRFFEANDNEQSTMSDLVNMMGEFLGDLEESVVSQFYVKKLVKERFGDVVVIAEINGKVIVVTLRPTAQTMLLNFYAQPNGSDGNQKKMNILSVAPELLKSDLKCVTEDMAEDIKRADLKKSGGNFELPTTVSEALPGKLVRGRRY